MKGQKGMFRTAMVLAFVTTAIPHQTYAADDMEEGRKAFKRCSYCHAVSGVKGGDFGPNLDGVFGQPVGRLADYKYSRGMKQARDAGMVWDQETLDAYIRNPAKLIKSPLKSIPGIRNAEVRQAIIDFLKARSTP